MPCCGDREKIGDMKLEQTWDYINLNDFKSSSCFTGFSYFMVWVFLGISIAVYAVDTFTAINLLVFNKWSSQIQPKIPFRISRWIFAGCIIASFVLLAYRWIRTIRVMRSGGIAESYLDPLAVRVQSIRVGKSKGYRRFLVFAELTKSKKGADYVALFAYFSFESWLRVCFADGPRQVLNAITLYSVMELDLIPTGSNAAPAGTSSVVQFFDNVKALAEKNYQQAVILFGMLFTLIIWVIAALSLILSAILYLIFLWHHIPTMDGSLKRYCRRKINTRLERIVRKKTATALAKGGLQLNERTPTMPLGEGEEMKPVKVAPTLPSVAEYSEDKKPVVTVMSLSRQPTQSTLPPYSEPDSHENEAFRQPKLPDLSHDNGSWLTRTNTQNSAYGDSASLTGGAAPMGYSPLDNSYGQPDIPPMPPVPSNGRPYSPAMNRPPIGPGRPGPTGPMPMEGLGRRPTGTGYSQTPPPGMGRQTPGFSRGGPGGPTDRSYSPATRMPYDRPFSPATDPPFDRQQTPQSNMHNMRPDSPANMLPPARSLTSPPNLSADPIDRIRTPGDRTASPRPPNQGGYMAYNQANMHDMRSNSPAINPPVRSFTSPGPNPMSSPADPVGRINTPGDRTASPRPPNQGGYVAFNPFSSSVESNTDTRSQSPISARPEPPASQGSRFRAYQPAASDSQSIVRPSTAVPSHGSRFDAHQPIVRAATTTPSNGFGRHEIHPQQAHLNSHEEDDDEYDPLSYYGSST